MKSWTSKELITVYRQWLDDLKTVAPSLLGNDYSNPYFSSIPEGWFETDRPRIMVVGEEGFGTWGCGKGDKSLLPDEVEAIQQRNFDHLREQIGLEPGKLKGSAFWRRFRKIAEFGVCCWTNIDKIHVLNDKRCALSKTDRALLHSVPIRLLQEEIKLLNPTHVVFFGWHGASLQHELPELYAKLYPNGAKDSSVWKQNVVSIVFEGRPYIFCYHPNWGYRNKWYEGKVISAIKETL